MSNDTPDLFMCVPMSSLDAVRKDLEAAGADIVELDGTTIHDKATFLAAVEASVPMPPGLTPHNWDALRDVLWRWLLGVGEGRVALVWRDAHELESRDLNTFLEAVLILHGVALRSHDSGTGQAAASLYLVVAGNATNFAGRAY
ncbi:MAG: hypothetical protein QOF96_3052 [Actinomycetota bacterium]|jgi:hypothetical protein|nr:hypothetical protein [Actinomycetota bacterium]